MKKTIFLTISLLVAFTINLNAQEYQLGQVVTNPDGSQGVVFYLHEDGTDGWMVALYDVGLNVPWGLNDHVPELDPVVIIDNDILTTVFSDRDGYTNTMHIREHYESIGYTGPYAAKLVDFENGWYLPAAGQLKMLYVNAIFYEPTLRSVGETMGLNAYWSSTVQNDEKAWYVQFGAPYALNAWAWNGYFSAMERESPIDHYDRSFAVRAIRNLDFSPTPAIGELQTPNVICGTGPIELAIPHLNHINTYGWEISADENFSNPTPYTGQYLDETYDGWYLRLWGIAENETLYSNVVRISAHDTSSSHQYVQSCEPYEWGGQIITQSGIYQQFLENQWGCDSIATLSLSIGENVEYQFMDLGCGEYDWNGQIYTQSGVYQQTFPAANGCDSIVTLYLNVKEMAPVSQISGESQIYYADNGYYTYSIDPVPGCFGYAWNIDNDWAIVSGADSNECTVNINFMGTATLTVKVYTECGFIQRALFINHDSRPFINVYPNPTLADFTIKLSGMRGKATIEIHDYLGQLIDRFSVNTEIESLTIPYSLKGKAAGIYLISVTNDYHVITKKLVKTASSETGYGY